MNLLTKNRRESLPYQYYFVPALFIAIAGVADTIYLAISHFRNYTDIDYASFCAISKAINCDTVSQSPWSILFNVPVAIWGLIGYLLLLVLLIPTCKNSETNRPLWSLLFFLAALYSVIAVFFGYISAKKIHSYCILCLLSYTISFGILFYSWIIRRRFCENSLLIDIKKSITLIARNRILLYSLLFLFSLILCLKIFLPHYWQYQPPRSDTSLSTGITDNGHPWIGATTPTLIIQEFSDYQCFQCAKMHYYLRRFVAENPEKMRLVHRNYPMDHSVNPHVVPEPFHIGSAKLALIALAAKEQNKFWEVNDALYREVRKKKEYIDIEKIAEETKLNMSILQNTLYSKENLKSLEADIKDGLKYEITGTPTYIVNGEKYVGSIPQAIIQGSLK